MNISSDNPGVVAPPPLLYASALIVVLVFRWCWKVPISSHIGAIWLGIGFIVLGVGVAIWGSRTMKDQGTNVNPLLPATAIVKSGPFRFSRNPLYLALTLVYLGLTLVLNTWWGIAVLVPLVIIMHSGVILREERYLEQKFGETYRQYCSKVRRYL